MSSDSQSNKYLLTINNPKEKGLDHKKIMEILINDFRTLVYIAMADEIGENGTYHTHIFVYFSSRVRFSKVKKSFSQAHIDKAKGSVTDNINYIRKEGKWENTAKAETKVPNTYEEWGDRPPDSKGKNVALSELYRMISDNMTNGEIIQENPDYILQVDKLDKVRTIILTERFKETVRLDLECIYISGFTGTGKTRGVFETEGYSNVYRITDYQHPFDGYACQPVICFDEFRSSINLKDMLLYCDIYPLELPSRYANKFACYNKIYIVSNWELEKQYGLSQKADKESWQAFLRRIKKVVTYDKSGNRTEYESVEKYLDRKKFVGSTDDEKPFP